MEGEALAIVWALNNFRHYTLGNKGLMTDQKPLVKLFGDRRLEEIMNPQLARLKEATLWWDFVVTHVSRVLNTGPDALSRKSAVSAVKVSRLLGVHKCRDTNPSCLSLPTGSTQLQIEVCIRRQPFLHLLAGTQT